MRPTGREVWYAPAKINLWLEIVGHLPDRMHAVDMCYQAIDLCDTVSLDGAPEGGALTCSVDGPMAAGVPAGADNLAARAARLLAERTGHDLRLALAITKAIPAGAGLGGGSSDAAAVLLALGRRFAVPDPAHTLLDLAWELGADVPFFLTGGTQIAAGTGERLSPVAPPDERWGILVYPGVSVSTQWAYQAWDERVAKKQDGAARAPTDSAESAAERPTRLPTDWNSRANALEPIVFERHPEVHQVLKDLKRGSAAVARMSGSGSGIFALYTDIAARDQELANARERLCDLPNARAWPFTCIGHGVRQVGDIETDYTLPGVRTEP